MINYTFSQRNTNQEGVYCITSWIVPSNTKNLLVFTVNAIAMYIFISLVSYGVQECFTGLVQYNKYTMVIIYLIK